MGSMFAMRFATLLFILPSISCNEVRNKDDGEEKATKTRHILCSIPITNTLTAQIQLSFYEYCHNGFPLDLEFEKIKRSRHRSFLRCDRIP